LQRRTFATSGGVLFSSLLFYNCYTGVAGTGCYLKKKVADIYRKQM
jgi:hypothetical protein